MTTSARTARRTVAAAAVALAALTAAACSSGTDADPSAVEAPTASTPTLSNTAKQGAAVNAEYWTYQIDTLDTTIKEFADYYAAEFCGNPKLAHLNAQLITMGNNKIFAIEYGIRNQKNPDWEDDAETQSTIAYYIVSNYCPEATS